METLADEPINLEYEPATTAWDQVFKTAREANCLRAGKRNGIPYEIIELEEPSTSDEEDPKKVIISRFTNNPDVGGITISTYSDSPDTMRNHYLEFFPSTESHRSTLYEIKERVPQNMDAAAKAQCDRIFQSIDEYCAAELNIFGANLQLVGFEKISTRGLLQSVDIMEVISFDAKRIELVGGRNRELGLDIDIHSGWRISREIMSFKSPYKYYALPIRKITIANLRLRRAIIES